MWQLLKGTNAQGAVYTTLAVTPMPDADAGTGIGTGSGTDTGTGTEPGA